MNPFNKLINWYFRKNSLPYWCIFLLDCAIVFFSGVFTYWLFNKTAVLLEDRFNVFYTLLIYVLMSWVGFRMFHTYSGIIRYSSFVDLTRVAWGNLVALVLSLIVMYGLDFFQVEGLGILSTTETCTMYVIATLVMWGVRVIVKTLFDVAASDKRALKVLIYGAMTGGVGLAKKYP
jgi:hypothetical protein